MCDELWYLWPTYAQTTGLAIKEEKPLLLLLPEAETVTSRVRFSFPSCWVGQKAYLAVVVIIVVGGAGEERDERSTRLFLVAIYVRNVVMVGRTLLREQRERSKER